MGGEMIPVRRGRGGSSRAPVDIIEWRGEMGKRLLGGVVVGLLVAVCCVGCKKKVPGPEAGAAAGGVGEEGLGAAGSLDRYKHGLGPTEGGPLKDIHFAFDSFELDEASR